MNVRFLAALVCAGLTALFGADTLTAGLGPTLILDGGIQATAGQPVVVPVAFFANGHTIAAVVLSLDIDTARLAFDPSDDDLDGIPDAISLPAGIPRLTWVDYDAADADGELDVALADLSGSPVPQRILLEIEMTPLQDGVVAQWIGFSGDPPVSFGDDLGQDVPGTAVVLGLDQIFVDSFESGDTSAWSDVEP